MDDQQGVRVPGVIVEAIKHRVLQTVANLLLAGGYEQSDAVPPEHRRILAEAVVSMALDPSLERAPCDHCSRVRREHPLAEDGFRYCQGGEAGQEPKRFQPGKSRIVLAAGG